MNTWKGKTVFHRSVHRFGTAKARIHVGSVIQRSIYASYPLYRCVCTQVPRLEVVYILSTSFYCYNILGLGLMSGYCYYSGYNIQRSDCLIQYWVVQRRLVDADILDVWLMLFMDPVWKFMKHGPWKKREGCSLL